MDCPLSSLQSILNAHYVKYGKAAKPDGQYVSDNGLPLEALYADDSDFLSLSPSFLHFLEALVPPTIGRFKLKANATKWERTALQGDNTDWRKTKKLGSLLGDEEDI